MAAPNAEKQKPKHMREEIEEALIRISSYDIPGSRKLLPGLTRIKGVGWTISNAVCKILKLSPAKKISELTKEEIAKIEEFIKDPKVQNYLKNRQKDLESGETSHHTGADLEMKRDFDIRRLKKIRSYKGIRHTSGHPVRGQRTRAHFRKKGQAVSVTKKKSQGKKS